MKVLVTGSNGFIGKNLLCALHGVQVIPFDREHDMDYLKNALDNTDFVYHLAANIKERLDDNLGWTEFIVNNLQCPILFASSIQTDTEYGENKRLQENIINGYRGRKYIYRLSNVFGRWCRPNYNSAVATFIYNVHNGQELTINDPAKEINLVYIDDVTREFKKILYQPPPEKDFHIVEPIYTITVGKLAEVIKSFNIDQNLIIKLLKTYNA